MRFCKINIHISNVILYSHFRWLSYAEAVPADDVGCRRCVISAERRGWTKQNGGHELEAQNEVKKNVRGFRYKPKGDWFSFPKIRKHCFLCSCVSQRRARAMPTSYVIRLDGFRVPQSAEVRKKLFITFEIWIFILPKRMDSLQETSIHALEPHYGCSHFISCLLDCWQKAPSYPHCKAWRGQDHFLYYSDWIRLKEECHIHLGCLEGEYIAG